MKSVKISELKAKLSKYLHMVRAGQELIVTDRKVPVARLVGMLSAHDLSIIEARMSIGQALEKMPKLKTALKTNSLAFLLEDRNRR